MTENTDTKFKDVEKLLKEIESVAKRNEELSALKGENFNVFRIFGIQSDENKMHSRFIETFLNPKGSHGRGTAFLELFLEALNIPDDYFDINAVQTKVEHTIGKVKIEGEKSTGGRIDIYIWDNKQSISIENKIYAVDQEKQIIRYCKPNKEKNKVFYLTLNGTEPSEGSKGTLKSDKSTVEGKTPDFYCISYSATILVWLEKCQKEASDFPIIRETIKQYIITVKRLTGQLTNQKMEMEIKELIIKNYKTAKLIADNIEKAKTALVNDFLDDVKNKLKTELDEKEWKIEKDPIEIENKWSGIRVSYKDWQDKLAITLQGQSQFWKHRSILGVPCKDEEIREKLKSLKDELAEKYREKSELWFFFCTVFNFGNDGDFEKLLSKEKKELLVESISSEIIELARKVKKCL